MPAAVLSYNSSSELVTQETYYNCGPGSCQLVLDARGIHVSEAELSSVLGTTTDGTPSIDSISAGLNHFDPESSYASLWMVTDPPTPDEVQIMRERIFRTIAWGRGCVANVVVPPSNYPRAVPKSDPNLPGAEGISPNYGGGIVFHYISILGADDTDDTVMIVDPGFQPATYWMTVSQLASCVTPHGLVYASGAPTVAAPGIPTLPGPAGPQVAGSKRFWPVTADRFVTSPFGPRDGGFHSGVDFGFHGGSGDRPVFAIQSGTVQFSGPAQGYGGPDPAGWIVIDSDDSQGSGVFEYGHVVRLPHIAVGVTVNAGDQIATINPDEGSNGGVAPHLHLSYMPRGYDPAAKMDPLPLLDGAAEPGVVVSAPPQHHLPDDPAAMIVNHHPQPVPAPTPAPQQQTCLTGRPHHHSENPPPDELLLDMRAEGLCTQALVYAIAEKLGLDAAGIYQSARDSF